MVLGNGIPASFVASAVRDIADFLGADLADARTWHNGPPALDGAVPMHHARSLWDIRQPRNLYEVPSEYFGHSKLMLDINRCGFRPPVHSLHPTRSHGDIHWDADPRAGVEATLQAGVLLSTIGRNRGEMQCIPEIYRNLNAWPEVNCGEDRDFDFRHAGLDLPNQPGMAMFVTLQQPEHSQEYRDQIKDLWLSRRASGSWRGLPRKLDPEPGAPAELTELGRKLLRILP